jgi:hypothetical protein
MTAYVAAAGEGVRHVVSTAPRAVRDTAASRLDRWSSALLTSILEAVLSRVDLTEVITKHVDLGAVMASIDLEDVASHLDLVWMANYIIEGVDLPTIIRSSSASVTSDAIQGLRVHGVHADDVVSRAVDRLIPRRRG